MAAGDFSPLVQGDNDDYQGAELSTNDKIYLDTQQSVEEGLRETDSPEQHLAHDQRARKPLA